MTRRFHAPWAAGFGPGRGHCSIPAAALPGRRIGRGRGRRRRAAGRGDQVPLFRRTRRARHRHQRAESGRRLHRQALRRSRSENPICSTIPPSSGSASPPEPAWAKRNELEFFGPDDDGEPTEAIKLTPARNSRRWPSAARASSICRWSLSATASRPRAKATTTTPAST